MGTRHKSEDDKTIYQQRYLSSPEFVEARGILAMPMALKVELLESEAERNLILFLQAMSLRKGGVRKLAYDIISAFPERIGTPTMHRLGMKSGQTYPAADVDSIERELGDGSESAWDAICAASLRTDAPRPGQHEKCCVERGPRPCQEFYARCCEIAKEQLPGFLIRLCIDPCLQFRSPEEKQSCSDQELVKLVRDVEDARLEKADVPYFKGIIEALFEFQRRFVENAKKDLVETSITKAVFACLEDAVSLGKIHIIEGKERIGKSTGGASWTDIRLGPVRLVKLNGFANKTTALRKIAEGLGIGSTHCHSPKDMEPLIFKVLQKTGITLVIDEAHFLFVQGQRIYSRPEMIDWFDTELYNNGIPVVLITTDQFPKCLERSEMQVGWNAEQFRGRVKRWTVLSEKETEDDLRAVAVKLLPGSDKKCITYAVGFALSSKRYMPALVDA